MLGLLSINTGVMKEEYIFNIISDTPVNEENVRQIIKNYFIQENSALFERFNKDLKNNALPIIPKPTFSEIVAYKVKRAESFDSNFLTGVSDMKKQNRNNSIPIEAEIWVDKVFKIYFDDLIPMSGLVHWCDGAKKDLYKYLGYT